MRAPVAGSGCAPACTASVSKPYSAIGISQEKRGLRAPQRPAGAEGGGLAVVDGAPVDPVPADLTREPAIFDFRAAIHDDGEPGGLSAFCRVFIDDAQLHPQDPDAQPVL